MRLIELLLVIMLEGRKALPKAIQPLVSRRMESFLGDRSHRQVIESIRSGNNDDFFEAMEGGMFVCMYACAWKCTCIPACTCVLRMLITNMR